MGYWGRARTRDKEDRFKTYAPILKSKNSIESFEWEIFLHLNSSIHIQDSKQKVVWNGNCGKHRSKR